jgi:hypothetical protein
MKGPGRCRVRPGLVGNVLQGVMRTLRGYLGRKNQTEVKQPCGHRATSRNEKPRPEGTGAGAEVEQTARCG